MRRTREMGMSMEPKAGDTQISDIKTISDERKRHEYVLIICHSHFRWMCANTQTYHALSISVFVTPVFFWLNKSRTRKMKSIIERWMFCWLQKRSVINSRSNFGSSSELYYIKFTFECSFFSIPSAETVGFIGIFSFDNIDIYWTLDEHL